MAHDNMWFHNENFHYNLDLLELMESPCSTTSSPCSTTSSPEHSPLPADTVDDFYSFPVMQMQPPTCGFNYTPPPPPVYATLEPVDVTALVRRIDAELQINVPQTYQRPRHCDLEVLRGGSDEYFVTLGGIQYPIDPQDTFDMHRDFPVESLPVPVPVSVPVPATEKTYTTTHYASTKRSTSHTGTSRNRKLPRAERLWEFILRLLLDPNYNPSYIEWVDRDRGMFRLVNSRQIARMWGKRKNNLDMTYEKLSRAMRYYYHRKILQPVFGKKLVYKFGPNSTGWQLDQH